jgi:elongation factor 1 alpha-like protein
VWEALPEGLGPITEKQIHDSLWHYYYDVDKTIAYLLKEHAAKPKKVQQKKIEKKNITGRFWLFSILPCECYLGLESS